MSKVWLNHGGTWKEPTKLFVKTGGAWVDPVGGYVKTGGVWEKFYPQGPTVDPALTLDLDFTAMTTLDPRITFSRTSLGTYYGADGLIKYAPHNFAWWSEDFTQTTWTKVSNATITADAATAPTGTTTADRLNHVTAGTVIGGGVVQTLATAATLFSIYAKAGSKPWVQLGTAAGTASNYAWFNLSTGTLGTKGASWRSVGIEAAGNGWYRCYGVSSAPITASWTRVAEADNSLNCTSPGDIYIWGYQAENVTTDTSPRPYLPTTTAAYHGLRFDHNPITHEPKGLLIEEARTNVVRQNRDLTQAVWVKTDCTAAKNQTGVDGGANSASSLTGSAANATCLQAITLASSARYQSTYVRRLAGSGVVNMTMDGGTTWTPVTVTSSWSRVEIPTATLTNPSVGFQLVTSGDSIAVDCVQNENGAFATSAILTTTATVARAADVAVMTGSNFTSWYNQLAGTFVVEFGLLAASGTRMVISADAGTIGNSIRLYALGTDPHAEIRNIAAVQADLDVGTIAANTTHKLGLSFAVNDVAACCDGGSVGTDTTVSLATTMTQLRIGVDPIANYLNGHVRRIRFWNTAKSDAELQGLTA